MNPEQLHNPLNRCGSCPLFVREDMNGDGWCRVLDEEALATERCAACTDKPLALTSPEALTVLHAHQKWRRDNKMIPPPMMGAAIDTAIRALRMTGSAVDREIRARRSTQKQSK